MLLFDPTNALSAAYNPLLEVRRGDTEVRDVQNVADILVDPEGALERREQPKPSPEFALLEDEPDDDPIRARALNQNLRVIARQAALDPDDGLGL